MLESGSVISGRYRVEELIGSGGMANVYRAYDIAANMIVALKVLKDEHREDADFLRRFEREAKAVLSLSHDNIVRSFDVGQDGDTNYIVLEYVEGLTLKEMIKTNGALSQKQAVNIASQILKALEHAHDNGIIHRDVKPQNVIITPEGTAKLTDFGIARDVDSVTRTFAGTNVIGSVHYLSPEQARGEDVTIQSDIYSTGIMLYEMLTGQVPFAGDNSVTVALKHLQEKMVPPDKIHSGINPSLSDVVMKAAAKDPKKRYEFAEDMRADLARSLKEPHGKFARITEDGEKKGKPKRRVLNIAVTLIVLLGMFAAMFFIFRAWRDDQKAGEPEFVIPVLQGKSIEDATALAEVRGFFVVIGGESASDEFLEGQIVSQVPESGVVAKEGDEITVIVSTGSEYTAAPNVKGMLLADAILELSGEDLNYRIVEYVVTDSPDGTIVNQEPEESTQMFRGDYMELWVSGSPDQSLEIPQFTGQRLTAVTEALHEDGFTRVWVRPITPDTPCEDETVVKQNPPAGTMSARTSLIELWVSRPYLGPYSADIAFNLDVSDADRSIVVTLRRESGVELVLFEGVQAAGSELPVTFTAYSKLTGQSECVLYVDGVEIKTVQAAFELK